MESQCYLYTLLVRFNEMSSSRTTISLSMQFIKSFISKSILSLAESLELEICDSYSPAENCNTKARLELSSCIIACFSPIFVFYHTLVRQSCSVFMRNEWGYLTLAGKIQPDRSMYEMDPLGSPAVDPIREQPRTFLSHFLLTERLVTTNYNWYFSNHAKLRLVAKQGREEEFFATGSFAAP